MADFSTAFEKMVVNEGGYVLHTVPGDRGGMTYAGIARNAWPQWAGWERIDAGATPDANAVRLFYLNNFWRPPRLTEVRDQRVAETLFDFGVNAGTRTAVVLAQTVVGATPDGVVGPKTLAAINAADAEMFILAYTLAKIARYRDIVTRDRTQLKFLLGWLNRALKGIAA